MSFNTSQTGREICIIKDNPTYKNKIISVSDSEQDGKLNHIFKDLHIKTGRFQIICDKTRDRDTIFVAGCAGSGKSYWIGQYIKEYIRIFPENPIYLFSEGDEDPALDMIHEIKRVPMLNLIDDPIDYKTELGESLCVFDDVDSIVGPLAKIIYDLRDKVLKCGRKLKISVISSNHNATEKQLKTVINESDTIVFFLSNYNRSLKYLLNEYLGLTKEGIKVIRKNKTRATVFIKSHPNCLIQDHNISLLNKIQE
jgi:hypothetical protein